MGSLAYLREWLFRTRYRRIRGGGPTLSRSEGWDYRNRNRLQTRNTGLVGPSRRFRTLVLTGALGQLAIPGTAKGTVTPVCVQGEDSSGAWFLRSQAHPALVPSALPT